MNNWGTVTSNKKGFQPLIINGRPVKSINQFYNKKKGKLQSELKDAKSSNRIKRLSTKRNSKIDDYLQKTSRYIINRLIENQIEILVIGNNPNWKQGINPGKKTIKILFKFLFLSYLKIANHLTVRSYNFQLLARL